MHEMANDKTIDPSARTPKASAIAIIKAFLPTERSFAIGYSRPTTNKSSTILFLPANSEFQCEVRS